METQQTTVQKAKMSTSFFFLSLGSLISLITSVVSFLNLVFESLNKRYPDVLNASYEYGYATYQYDNMRMSLATLIIFFPIFLVVSYFWKKHYAMGVGQIDEAIRKWMLYIVIFLSSLVVAIDLVTLVRYFVSGEITTRFILKVTVTLLVALLVGGYYLLSLQKKTESRKINLTFSITSAVLVLIAIISAFSVMGSPFEQRKLRLDDRRVSDLQNIQWQVINYWQQKEKLPENISELNNPLTGAFVPVDPEFEKGLNYEYRKKGDLDFELCATFALPMPKGWREYSNGGVIPMPMMEGKDIAVSYPYPMGANESWDHEAGLTCFVRTIDPDIYPPFEKPVSR